MGMLRASVAVRGQSSGAALQPTQNLQSRVWLAGRLDARGAACRHALLGTSLAFICLTNWAKILDDRQGVTTLVTLGKKVCVTRDSRPKSEFHWGEMGPLTVPALIVFTLYTAAPPLLSNSPRQWDEMEGGLEQRPPSGFSVTH
jgi:hypothetical protein